MPKIPIEVRVATDPEGRIGVLLQLPDAYVIVQPDDARKIAGMLQDAAVEAALDSL